MAVTGVNNYSNIYTNAYTGNIQKNNAKETTEKQVVEQTEDVKTGTTRKTAADELSYLSKKFDNYSFVSANYSPGMKYGKSTTTNVAIFPQFLTKMANDSDLEDEYIKEIGNMKKLDEQFAKQQADIGWRVEQGWAIDKDGNISSWAIGHKDSKVKSFLQNMSEKAEEILQKQLEKAKDTKEEKRSIMQKKCIALREPCVCQMKSMPSSDLKEYSVRLTAMQILIQKLQNLASLLIVTELPHSLQS